MSPSWKREQNIYSMKNIIYIALCTLTLTGCLSAKVSHKSEVKTNIVDNAQKQAEAKIDEDKETHTVETRVDTVVVLKEVQGAERIRLMTDPNCLTNQKPIKKTVAFGKGWIAVVYTPKTGYLDVSGHIPPDTVRVQADVKQTSTTEHRTSSIDSSSSKKTDRKNDVKGSTAVSVSLFQMSWMKWVFLVVGLAIGIFIGRKSKK